jgi:hypothetical protein
MADREPPARPVRLQLSRRKGFNLQELSRQTNGLPAVVVTRPGRWGNPFDIATRFENELRARLAGVPYGLTASWCGELDGHFDHATAEAQIARIAASLDGLRGKNIACWCGYDERCHADILLTLASMAADSARDPEAAFFAGDEARP